MAKQTFTTGQVLTAAQMTSLQQTAMGGGAATAKTANYVLVAADAGTTVAMNAAGATTITVNTGLFAAGDTVFIQNLGAGACTVTAGTATVATAGSLILPQNDAGILYFTATGAAIFYDYIQAGAVSPLTTKGDLYTFSTSDARLAVGANGTTLVADSSEATGLKWATASSGGMTLLSTTSLSGSSVTISSIDQTYTDLFISIYQVATAANDAGIRIAPNGSTNIASNQTNKDAQTQNLYASTYLRLYANDYPPSSSTSANSVYGLTINNYSASRRKSFIGYGTYHTTAYNQTAFYSMGGLDDTTAISSLTISLTTSTFSSGTVLVYGVK